MHHSWVSRHLHPLLQQHPAAGRMHTYNTQYVCTMLYSNCFHGLHSLFLHWMQEANSVYCSYNEFILHTVFKGYSNWFQRLLSPYFQCMQELIPLIVLTKTHSSYSNSFVQEVQPDAHKALICVRHLSSIDHLGPLTCDLLLKLLMFNVHSHLVVIHV